MSQVNDGGPAFPLTHTDPDGRHDCMAVGLTKREWFAGQALAGIAYWDRQQGGSYENGRNPDLTDNVRLAYQHADAMLAELEKP